MDVKNGKGQRERECSLDASAKIYLPIWGLFLQKGSR